MNIADPSALRYLLQDDIYLLKADVAALTNQPAAAEPSPEPVIEQTVQPTFKYHGGNQKSFLITVHYPSVDVMEEAHLTALTNTLKMKGLAIDDVAILNLAQHSQATHDAVLNFFKPTQLLILGENAMPLDTAPLTINQTSAIGTCRALYSYSFNEMLGNKEKTRAFWEQMKNL